MELEESEITRYTPLVSLMTTRSYKIWKVKTKPDKFRIREAMKQKNLEKKRFVYGKSPIVFGVAWQKVVKV